MLSCVEREALIHRDEVVAMLLTLAGIKFGIDRVIGYWRTATMAKRKKRRAMTPEERARWDENQRRLEELIERALARLGKTREQIRHELGLPE
jgi:hypothetical protein